MRPLALFAIGITFAAFAAAQETTTAPPPAPSKDEALIKAAQTTKAKRKTASAKVITNADVKKSKGKLIVLPPKAKDGAAAEPAETMGTQQKHDLNLKERTAATERVLSAQKKVDELQKELNRLEQRFYEENDPNYRDDVIQKRFAQTKKQLDAARQELANARDASGEAENPAPK